MGFSDELQAISKMAFGRRSADELTSLSDQIELEYQERLNNASDVEALEGAVADAEVGPAAYAIGRHYLAHQSPEAERWLRVAADFEIGDASLLLARMCEAKEVKSFNAALDMMIEGTSSLAPELISEAHQWYRRAEMAGYREGGGWALFTENPYLPIICCQAVQADVASRQAEVILAEARRKADAIVAQATADARAIRADASTGVQDILTMARTEYSELSKTSRLLESVIHHQAAALHEFQASQASSATPERSWRRTRNVFSVRRLAGPVLGPVARTIRFVSLWADRALPTSRHTPQ